MKRKSFVGILMVIAAALVLPACGQMEWQRWMPEERAGQAVISGNVRFTDGYVQSAAVCLLVDEGLRQSFVLDGASGSFEGSEVQAAPWAAELALPLTAAELALPMTAAEMERFAETCRQWMLEEHGEIAVFDVSFDAEKAAELATRTAQALLSSVGSGPPLTYSIADARLGETDGQGLTENALGLGMILSLEGTAGVCRQIIILP